MRELLVNGAADLGVCLNDAAVDRLFAYKEFLKEYNKKVNLTSIVDDEEIVVKHFLDSLTLVSELASGGRKVIDIGSGAGFPGVVLKIVMEDLDLVLMDSLNKRIRFLNELVGMLGLGGVRCVHGRAEELARRPEYREGFDFAVARAVANLTKLSGYCLPYVRVGGMFIAMKGRNYHEDVSEADGAIKSLGGKILEVKEIGLPGSDIVHSIIKIEKIRSGISRRGRA